MINVQTEFPELGRGKFLSITLCLWCNWKRKKASRWKKGFTHAHTHTRARMKWFMEFAALGFPNAIVTVNPAAQLHINLVKLMHKIIIRSLLTIEKGTSEVLTGQLKAFWTHIWAKFQNRFVWTLKLMGLPTFTFRIVYLNEFVTKTMLNTNEPEIHFSHKPCFEFVTKAMLNSNQKHMNISKHNIFPINHVINLSHEPC